METAAVPRTAGSTIPAASGRSATLATYIRRVLVAALLSGGPALGTRTPIALEALDDRLLKDIGLRRDQLPFLATPHRSPGP